MNTLVPESDNILRTRCDEWDFSSQTDAAELIERMVSVMRCEGGIGLSANQIGLNHRVFIMEMDSRIWACFNPEVIHVSKEQSIFEEGCLSFPDLRLKIKRPAEIAVKYQDIHGNYQEEELTGILARCYLHEMDHLNGVCFVDNVSRLALTMALKRRAKNKRNR